MSQTSAETVVVQQAQKFLTFHLALETYGLPILQVREILGLMEITRVPRMPEFMLGVINLRGRVIPVADLRLKFGLEANEMGRETCIIVVELANFTMGLLVDKVSEVVAIHQENITDAPSFGMKVNTDFILGIARQKEKVIILLDIQRVLETEDIVQILDTTQLPLEEKGDHRAFQT